MKRKVSILISSAFLLGASSAYASTDEDFYGRDNNGNKVIVQMGNQYIYDPSVPNFLMNNRTVVPLKAFGDTVGAFVQQLDSGTVELIKPNVNLVVSEGARVNNDGNQFSIDPFSAVTVGQSIAPHIYYVVDNAPVTDALEYRIDVLDPYNKEIYSTKVNTINTEEKGPGFVGIFTLDEISFENAGNYKVQFLMKRKSENDFLKVGQTIIKANE
ncbi:MAG TPA: hypothetical protein VJ824_08145 [Bacillota bacterium]|nr:hypothetical protein [Bacillota bacterium]